MTKRMLIDANHPEETRVVILDGSKVEEFDFEAASKRPLKGNIYLAKVTRVEPSLQAAFVEYGGNRQGFLAFAEIHPDYYQIPMADRQALLAEQEAEARRRQEDDIESFEITGAKSDDSETDEDAEEEADGGEESVEMAPLVPLDAAPESEDEDDSAAESGEDEHEDVFVNHGGAVVEHDHDDEEPQTKPQAASEALPDYQGDAEVAAAEAAEENEGEIQPVSADGETSEDMAAEAAEDNEGAIEPVSPEGEAQTTEDQITGDQGADAQALQAQRPPQKWVRKKHYKIQEVIKRRQIILVQVVKEERGNKGAALTTYLSLAGRYCVLMPNTPRGGGISRKITNAVDRKRLKSAAQGLELPEGMGLIIRTAGENRTRIEIRRDYDYLLRLWDTIREKTLSSNAPACVYEEGDLIKRVIRDLYNKDVQDVVVEGEQGFRNAKDFMRMLMPGHARNVHQYRDTVPLYQRMHIEAQLDAMFSPTVTLKSGGYIVINQTEALVSIDVNSGRATREHSIEETARKTNLEAASEIGRQLRLRDLAGLIVIDFIDMEEGRNDREVEKRLRDAVKNDRARVQIGKISQFGLMEMSRQRLRAGVIAGSTVTCPHCAGTGLMRSTESTALRVLRGLEEEGEKNRAAAVIVCAALAVVAAFPFLFVRMPGTRDALSRIDRGSGLPHRPATAIADDLAVTPKDPYSLALWNAHVERALNAARALKSGWPSPRVARRDPYALRALVLIACVATFFAAGGERWKRITAAFDWHGVVLPANFRVDAWVIPPVYTGKPPVILPGIHPGETAALSTNGIIAVPVNSTLVVRSTGKVSLDVSGLGGVTPAKDAVKAPAGVVGLRGIRLTTTAGKS